MRHTTSLIIIVVGALWMVGCSGEDTVSQNTTGSSNAGGSDGSGGAGGAGAQGGSAGDGGSGGGPSCTEDSDCDDGIDCTVDTCDGGQCSNGTDDSVCDDGSFCNGAEICDPENGDPQTGCVAGTDPCDDGADCTQDSCDEEQDSCTNMADDTVCDDGMYCNGAELCDPENGDPQTGCLAGADPCDDGIDCTQDSCDEQADSCTNTPDDTVCDDAMYCNGAEICDPANGDPTTGCLAGQDPCNDGFSCTQDSCDEQNDSCTNAPDDTVCDDATFCNGAEICDPQNGAPMTGCAAGTDPCDDGIGCTQDSCDEQNDSCTNSPDDVVCDDNVFCNGPEVCNTSTGCESANMPPSCDDGIGCTTDFCDPNTDSCQSTAVDSNCDDGQFCNGQETCDPANGDPTTGCLAGTAVTCDDQIPCTVDTCDENNDQCDFSPDDNYCDDNQFCNGQETCQAGVGCVAGSAVNCDDGYDCTSEVCDESADSCVITENDQFCDDGVFCNGAETCDPANGDPTTGCAAGTSVTCQPDAYACTDDVCTEDAMGCESIPNDANCPSGEVCRPSLGGCVAGTPCQVDSDCDSAEDGDLCNGTLYCSSDNICEVDPSTIVDCDDGYSCTVDSCDPSTGTCSNTPDDSNCDDGFACNGLEICDPANGDPSTGCVAGTPVDCDDGIACTTDNCTEPNGTCENLADNSYCDDGIFCNGSETCDVTQGCLAGTPPSCDDGVACTVDTCDSSLDVCLNTPDDTQCACGETCDASQGCGDYCQISECQGKVYECGDCVDNDNDCMIDTGVDPECLGPCDNNESGYKGEIPGQNSAPCKHDCYFDGDTGSGNDDCNWSHECDPLEPSAPQCTYDPNASIPGTNLSCAQLEQSQSQLCLDYCGPLVPNGCDCFGCCDVPGLSYAVFLGSEDSNGNGTCTTSTLNDQTKCKPCTQVQACLNTCETCELCFGKDTLPSECTCQQCPEDVQLCGDPCGSPCPPLYFCNNGCCVLEPG